MVSGMRFRAFSLFGILVSLITIASCSHPFVHKFDKSKIYSICKIPTRQFPGTLKSFMASHGINCDIGSIGTGRYDLYIQGTEADVFHFRTLANRHAEEMGWEITWSADGAIWPDDPDYAEMGVFSFGEPKFVRVAKVPFDRIPTQRVLAVLRGAGVNAQALLGTTDDDISVPIGEAGSALRCLSEASFPWVTLIPLVP